MYMNPFIEKILGTEAKKEAKPAFVIGKIHANWCGHCISLAPKWTILVRQLHKIVPKKHNLVIADIESETMDAGLAALNATHLPDSEKKVELNGGYPTIFKIMNKTITYYEGPREVKPMLKWAIEGIKTKPMTQKRHHKRARKTTKSK